MTICTRDNYNLLTKTGKIIIYATEAAIYSNIRQIMIQFHVLKLNKILHTIHYHHALHNTTGFFPASAADWRE